MKIQSRLMLGAVVVLGLDAGVATAALSADRMVKSPPRSAPSPAPWAGSYLGVHAGYGWDRGDFHSQFVGGGGADPRLSGQASGGGILGGLQAGYDWQRGAAVLGLQGAFSWSAIEGEAGTPGADPVIYGSRFRWLATLTTRAGFASGDVLYYVKAGAAFADTKVTTVVEDVPGSGRSTRAGWTAGGGIERRVAPGWTVAAEYEYLRFGESRHAFFFPPGAGTVNHGRAGPIHVVKFLLNYKPAQVSVAASAAPRSAAGAANWSGFYAGVHAGWGWGSTEQFDSTPATSPSFRHDGSVGGLTAGYNWQSGAWVFGVESDFSFADIRGTLEDSTLPWGCGPSITPDCHNKVEWFGTVRGRVGHAFDHLLPYVTAGLAYGRVYGDFESCAVFCIEGTEIGWTAGAGFEWAFAANWSAKLEYLFVDLGRFHRSVPGSELGVDSRFNVIRAGLNWKFGSR